jgi:hypothetical protein
MCCCCLCLEFAHCQACATRSMVENVVLLEARNALKHLASLTYKSKTASFATHWTWAHLLHASATIARTC